MKNNKKLKCILIPVILIIFAIAIALVPILLNKKQENKINVLLEYNEEDENVNWKQDSYQEIELKESVTITKKGTYHLTGNIENGNITVNAGDEDFVKLVLDNANITCNDSSAINIVNAKKVIVTIEEQTTNTLTDGTSYLTVDEPDSTIFSKSDLVINGAGTLNINANYLDGITSKDGLKIIGTTINITANDDGIRGKDYVGIKNATININSNSDGIKSTHDTDEEKGYIVIENSNLNIQAEQDGIQAETNLKITSGEITIKTGGGSENSSTKEEWGQWSMKKGMNNMEPQTTTNTTNEISAKAIKANLGIVIENGNFNINSSDDSIHTNGNIIINNGTFEIQSGDDGIHADESITINNGNINILKSYEGIESTKIDINEGNINLVVSDDGINIAGGNDGSAINGRPGQNNFSSNPEQILTINNGYIVIDAIGDGIDINGSAYINGGTVIVNGPTNDGNGALDYDSAFEINGGKFIAVGSSGMMQTPSNGSTIYSISYVFSSTQQANSKISLKTSNTEEIISYTPTKTYSSVIISSEELKEGEVYTIYLNDEKLEEITINNIVTSLGNNNMQMQGGGNKNPMQGGMKQGMPGQMMH